MKRLFLFILTNALIVLTLSVLSKIVGLDQYVGLHFVMMFSLLWGMGGSLISLFLSKWMAKRAYGVNIIDPRTHDSNERILYTMVETLAKEAKIKTPEVGYYLSNEVNAFATGWSKNNSLVAVSSGLVEQMAPEEVEAVLGHEIAHIKNGDMVTLVLIQGIVNSFALFLARVLAIGVSQNIRGEGNQRSGGLEMMLTFLFEMILVFLGSLVVMWFSRYREYRADLGGAILTSKEQMVNALARLGNINQPSIDDSMKSMKINGGGWAEWFSTHPRLEKRIQVLMKSRI